MIREQVQQLVSLPMWSCLLPVSIAKYITINYTLHIALYCIVLYTLYSNVLFCTLMYCFVRHYSVHCSVLLP